MYGDISALQINDATSPASPASPDAAKIESAGMIQEDEHNEELEL